jgi:hypothetical protein
MYEIETILSFYCWHAFIVLGNVVAGTYSVFPKPILEWNYLPDMPGCQTGNSGELLSIPHSTVS